MGSDKRAFISVYNKERIVEFCQYLTEYGYELVATEGTCKVLRKAGLDVLSAQELCPEARSGRPHDTSPLYMALAAGLNAEAGKGKGKPVRLVVVNLYPFKEDMEAGLSFEEAAAHIETGGVALLDEAAKHYASTSVVCDPDDYDRFLCDLAAGEISEEERKYFVYKAFSYTASYNALVAQYLSRKLEIPFPKTLTVTYEKAQDMRYGENPHQRAAVYREPLLKEGSLARAKQLAGGVMTYNNINDANAALELVKEFDEPAVVIAKHRVPCAAAVGESVFEAFGRAAAADPLKCVNGIIAVNGVVDARLADAIAGVEAEVVLAVGFTPEAFEVLRFRTNVILLEMPGIRSKVQFSTFAMQKIYGGLLVQTYDRSVGAQSYCITRRKPTEREVRALNFNYKVVKHARSSAVVLGTETHTVGIGSGQFNRTMALKAALAMAGDRASGCALATESDLLSEECVKLCRDAGIKAVIGTGNCPEPIVALCDEYGISVLCTDERHFKN